MIHPRRVPPLLLSLALTGGIACAQGTVEAAPASQETKPQETKPQETKPQETKPQEAQDAVVLVDLWSTMMMNGEPVGYVHSITSKTGEGKDALVHTKVETVLEINRLGAKTSISSEQTTVERWLDGKLVSIESSSKMSDQLTESSVTFKDGKARIATMLMGRERVREVDVLPETVGPYFLIQRGKKEGFAEGTSWDAVMFLPDQNLSSEIFVDQVGSETLELAGESMALTKFETEIDKMGMVITTWVDKDCIPVKTLTPVAGITMESMITTEAEARAAVGKGELGGDVFASSMVVAKQFIPFARSADAVTITLRPVDADKGVAVESTASQTVTKAAADGSRRITIKRRAPHGNAKIPPAADNVEVQEALKPSAMIQSDAKQIRDLAAKIVGTEDDPWVQAQLIESWVFENVTDKNFNVGFASALEVCENREGDCSEHSVLFAGLARAAGIPSRVVMGVLYIGGVWAGHAWNEVWIEDAWYPLDATLGLGVGDPMRIAMSSMTMQDDKSAAEMLRLVQQLGQLQIQVDEVVLGEERIDVQAENAVTMEAQTYKNRLWGFELTVPRGFEFEPESPTQGLNFDLLEVEGENAANSPCEFTLSVLDLPADFSWELVAKEIKSDGEGTPCEVDGRKGRVFERGEKGKKTRRAYVIAGDMLFVLALDRVTGDPDREMFDATLQTVDFDLER